MSHKEASLKRAADDANDESESYSSESDEEESHQAQDTQWPPRGADTPHIWEIADDLADRDEALAELRAYLNRDIAVQAERRALTEKEELERRRNPEPVKVEGNVPPTRLEEIKRKYGDTLVSVREIEPFSMDDMSPMGAIAQGLNTVFEAVLGYRIDVEMDPTLVSRYDANCSGMPELPIDPLHAAIRITSPTVLDEHRQFMRTHWKTSDAEMARFDAMFSEIRKTVHAPLSFFQPMPDRTPVAMATDTTDQVIIYALCSHMLSHATSFAQKELVARICEYIAKEMVSTPEGLDRCKRAPQIRVAWHSPVRYGGRLAFYMSPSTYPGQLSATYDERAAESHQQVDALVPKFQDIGLVDSNCVVDAT